MQSKKEFGDYQTPQDFANYVCQFLQNDKQLHPHTIIEPTCGQGNFIKAGLTFNAQQIIGLEVNPQYCQKCLESITDPRVKIINSDFFHTNWTELLKNSSVLNDLSNAQPGSQHARCLVLGNPPWVNNSTLTTLKANLKAQKSNFKQLKGIEAITGAGDFDICETIIWELITQLTKNSIPCDLALLCKTSVARNIFKQVYNQQEHINCHCFEMYEFNANKVFKISASACLLFISLNHNPPASTITISELVCKVYDLYHPAIVKQCLTLKQNHIIATSNSQYDFQGQCCFTWRQGIKHDCAKLMELTLNSTNYYTNGLAETVELETDLIYPLVKSSSFKTPLITTFTKFVLVTQKQLKQDTSYIQTAFPKTWQYLQQHRAKFTQRKSSIYKHAPEFAMFGVGEYAFSEFKVGVSGFYKKPLFAVLGSSEQRPVMVDDTCYFLSFNTYDLAYTAMLLLNSRPVQNFLQSIAFLDNKRPFSKKVLDQIDFSKILQQVDLAKLMSTESSLNLSPYLTANMVEQFKELVNSLALK